MLEDQSCMERFADLKSKFASNMVKTIAVPVASSAFTTEGSWLGMDNTYIKGVLSLPAILKYVTCIVYGTNGHNYNTWSLYLLPSVWNQNLISSWPQVIHPLSKVCQHYKGRTVSSHHYVTMHVSPWSSAIYLMYVMCCHNDQRVTILLSGPYRFYWDYIDLGKCHIQPVIHPLWPM